eukprot:scpid101272/ scgid22801/ 
MLPSFLTPEIDFMCPCVQASQFAAAHLPHAVNVPKGGAGGTVVEAHEGNFAIWAGTLIPKDDCIFIVATAGDEYESLERLARIGYTVGIKRSTISEYTFSCEAVCLSAEFDLVYSLPRVRQHGYCVCNGKTRHAFSAGHGLPVLCMDRC